MQNLPCEIAVSPCAADRIEAARRWLSGRGRTGPVALWGVRLGCLLALDALRRRSDGCPLCVLWQPVANGAAFLTQFLRVRTAAGLTRAGPGAETPKALRARLEAGETLEIGGYALAPSLARAIDGLALADLGPPPCRVVWREVAGGEPAEPSPASGAVIDAWGAAGAAVDAAAVTGPSFWALQEPEFAPALISAASAAVAGAGT